MRHTQSARAVYKGALRRAQAYYCNFSSLRPPARRLLYDQRPPSESSSVLSLCGRWAQRRRNARSAGAPLQSRCKVQLKNAPWWSRKMPPPPVSPTDPIIELCPARFVLFSVLQPPTFVGCFQHKARVGEPNNEGLSHLGVPKDVYPFFEIQVRCDQD